MKRKIASGIMLTLLFIGTLTLAFNIQPVKTESKTIYVDDDNTSGPWDGTPEHPYQNITSGLKYALAGDTIFVYSGTYTEHIIINKENLTLIGENRSTTIIDAPTYETAVEVTANNIIFRDFTTRANGWLPSPYNIMLNETANTVIADNNIAGEESRGIGVYTSTNITLRGNNITVWGLGVGLSFSSYVSVAENKVNASSTAVALYKSFNNTVTDNNLTRVGTGIQLSESFNNTIVGNSITGSTLSDEYWGSGIYSVPYSGENDSSYNTFCENDIRNFYLAIGSLFYWPDARANHNNVFLRNNITNNYHGVNLYRCFNYTFKDNTISGNVYNFGVSGFDLPDYIHDIDTSNTVNGKPVYYLVNQRNLTINPSTFPDVGYLALINSTNITVENLDLQNNRQGLLMASTRNSRITNNNIENNQYGIYLDILCFNNTISGNNVTDQDGPGVWLGYSFHNTLASNVISNNRPVCMHGACRYAPGVRLYGSFNNTLTCNTIANNSHGGVWLDYSSSNVIVSNIIANNSAEELSDAGVSLYQSYVNRIFHNNFINNQRQAYASLGNIWDDGYPSGGNYWSDNNPPDIYSGSNQDIPGSDGIGDTSYIIDENNTDRYPLMYPYGYVPSPDVNGDGTVDINDIVLCALAFGSKPGDSNWNPFADCNQDGLIDIFDLVMIGIHFGETW